MNYFEHHIGDYLKDTAHLSLLEHGIYRRLMDVYYTRESAIPAAEVARLIGARSRDEREALQAVLGEFFILEAEHWRQTRCDAEIARFQDKQRKAKAAADARWSESGRNADAFRNADASSMRTHTERNATRERAGARPQSPDTKPNSEAELPQKTRGKRAAPESVAPEVLIAAGFDAKTAAEFIAHKAAQKAPLTPRAWADHQREALKAGWSPQQAADKVMAKAWKGFEAKYVADERPPVRQGLPPPESFRQRDERDAADKVAFLTGRKPANQTSPQGDFIETEVRDVTPRQLG